MNIFYLSNNQKECVRWYVNVHVVKMTLESTQLLSSVYYFTNQEEIAPYRLSHANHPCAIWVRSSLDNWIWLATLAVELCKEYYFRYGKRHACILPIQKMLEVPPTIQSKGFITPTRCMPAEFKVSEDPIECYKMYYAVGKQHLFKWYFREQPSWIQEYQQKFLTLQ